MKRPAIQRLAMLSVVLALLVGLVGVGLNGCGTSKQVEPVPVSPSAQAKPDAALLEQLKQNEAQNREQQQLSANRAPALGDTREPAAEARNSPIGGLSTSVSGNAPQVQNQQAQGGQQQAGTRGEFRVVPPSATPATVAQNLELNKTGAGTLSIFDDLQQASQQGQIVGGGGAPTQTTQAFIQQGGAASLAPAAGAGSGVAARGGAGGARARGAGAGGGGGGGRAAPGASGPATSFFGVAGGRRGPAPRIIWPTSNEEVWIIVRPRPQVVLASPVISQFPRTGALIARLPDRPQEVAVPLKHTDVKASISGYVATVDVTQQFQNPFSVKIEAVYVFPLPDNAAVNEFVMTVGERKIRGIIRERQEAEQIYAQARAQGYTASLLTQERPNIFTQKVANIEPSKQIDINIRYYHTLEYNDGWYEWHFPMVVGPRFNPSGWTDGVGAVPAGGAGTSGQPTEVQYLNPDQRNGHDISLTVQVNAGVKIEQIDSRNHRVAINNSPQNDMVGSASVRLDPSDSIPNKDFVLRYKIAGQTLKSALMVQRDPRGQGGYFTLMLVPPETMKSLPRQPLEMVFTLDVSGSMTGKPIEQARAAIEYALRNMNPQDTFQVIRFATQTERMTDKAVPATPENIQAALAYVQQMSAGGGTNMMDGLRTSLQFARDEERTRYVAFLTDGFIGNEAQILHEIHNSLADSRIFSFGVGNSVNRYLLDHMAKMGAGAVTYLGLNDDAKEIMSLYFDRISHPALSDIKVEYGGMQVADVYPAKVPDLFVGRPVILTGRFTGSGPQTVRVTGRLGRETRTFEIPINLDDSSVQHPGITSVWARMKIAALADQSAWDDSRDLTPVVKQVAIDHGLMSQFTAFVAVDSSTRTDGGSGVTVGVPVPVPDGVRYDTTVPETNRPVVLPRGDVVP